MASISYQIIIPKYQLKDSFCQIKRCPVSSAASFRNSRCLRLSLEVVDLEFLRNKESEIFEDTFKAKRILTRQENHQESTENRNNAEDNRRQPVSFLRQSSCDEWSNHGADSGDHRCSSNGNVSNDGWEELAAVEINRWKRDATVSIAINLNSKNFVLYNLHSRDCNRGESDDFISAFWVNEGDRQHRYASHAIGHDKSLLAAPVFEQHDAHESS